MPFRNLQALITFIHNDLTYLNKKDVELVLFIFTFIISNIYLI